MATEYNGPWGAAPKERQEQFVNFVHTLSPGAQEYIADLSSRLLEPDVATTFRRDRRQQKQVRRSLLELKLARDEVKSVLGFFGVFEGDSSQGGQQEPDFEGNTRHSQYEVAAIQCAQKIVRDWGSESSYDVIPRLYGELFPEWRGSSFYTVRRQNEAIILGSTTTTVHPWDLPKVFALYTDELDSKLKNLPSSPEHHVDQIVRTAAWAYYVFEKIHPFTDGNGRIGRMIVKRILKGAGLRDVIFNDPRWYGQNQSAHLEALEKTSRTGDLSHVEVYLLSLLQSCYPPYNGHQNIRREIDDTLMRKRQDIALSTGAKGKYAIWDGFRNSL